MKLISYLQIRTHIWTFFRWENLPERGIQSASEWRKYLHFSDDSSEHLWLAIAFISSTASFVIDYYVQHCKNASVSGSAPASKSWFEFSSWFHEALNDLITQVWLYQIKNILFCLFFVFWKLHTKSTWLKNLRGHVISNNKIKKTSTLHVSQHIKISVFSKTLF